MKQLLGTSAIVIITILLINTMITTTKANDTTAVLTYLVREPVIKSAHPPVIFLLHGVGSNEQDLFAFAHQLPEKYLVISARGPITLGANSFAWYQVDFSSGKPAINFQQEEESRAILTTFIGQMKEKYAINPDEIYVCGFSQGAIMSYCMGLTHPDLVKGIGVWSGRLLEEIKPFIADKEQLPALQVFVSHGTNDQMLSINYAKQGVAYLETLGIHPVYKEYQEGHGLNRDMLADFINWLK
jgi:phospholipase/carboxylesterase